MSANTRRSAWCARFAESTTTLRRRWLPRLSSTIRVVKYCFASLIWPTNNVVKGWRSRSHNWIVIADSNVLMPRDYIQRLFASWRPDTGLVASPPIGSHPSGFWAEIECAFLNTYQARWQYIVDSFGSGFAQGKTMLWRRADLERAGGIEALGKEVAEDPQRLKLFVARGSKCAWWTGRWRSRSAGAMPARSGIANCAGRGCGAPAFSFISCPKLSQAACRR
jgi:hypothetical protein